MSKTSANAFGFNVRMRMRIQIALSFLITTIVVAGCGSWPGQRSFGSLYLVFLTQPTSGVAGTPFDPPLKVGGSYGLLEGSVVTLRSSNDEVFTA
jgi:hypothetical protein